MNVHCKLWEHHSEKSENAVIDMVFGLTSVYSKYISDENWILKFRQLSLAREKETLKKELTWENMMISL